MAFFAATVLYFVYRGVYAGGGQAFRESVKKKQRND